MAYFTTSRMSLMILEMYNANNRFADGATDYREKDIRVLIECQQKALVLGEYIESMGMDYSSIVSKFERYCNMIYEMAENLDNNEIIIDRHLSIGPLLWEMLEEIENRIVEISSIDIYDFSNLVETDKEKVLVEKEINRLIENCLSYEGTPSESEEYTRPIAVGTY